MHKSYLTRVMFTTSPPQRLPLWLLGQLVYHLCLMLQIFTGSATGCRIWPIYCMHVVLHIIRCCVWLQNLRGFRESRESSINQTWGVGSLSQLCCRLSKATKTGLTHSTWLSNQSVVCVMQKHQGTTCCWDVLISTSCTGLCRRCGKEKRKR